MNELRLYNTRTDKKEPFAARTQGRVKLFTCGPSVYRRQHLGNYRTYLFEDVLHKYLEYLGFDVQRVINFTDIEDKAIEEAREEGLSVEELRRPVEEAFFRESEMLGIHLPNEIPRASTSVDSAVELIQVLMEHGHAYRHQGDIFFDPLTYEGFGRLFGLDMSRWPDRKVRFRRDTYPGQRWNLGDFILWHKRRQEDGRVWWETAIGQGRPAWNIQDAAMIKKHLGFEIDIHTGGIDNLYRHHDYTLAIMEGASGKSFCPWWLHGGHLLVNGRKMSKSKGNVTYMGDLLEWGFQPRHIRFFLLSGPYRDQLDLRMPHLDERAGYLDRIRRLAGRLFIGRTNEAGQAGGDPASELRAAFQERMNDNLDFAGAFDAIADHLIRAVSLDQTGSLPPGSRSKLCRMLRKADRILGVLGCAEQSETR
ncbi:MAG: class I tRNA ligase family protein [Desulfohalobiaceae bacterium]|nr:class I tRNA ligase family protein [Desulfohalobiaceae bacterium]